jgi:glucose-6-phosphate isomerase
MGETLPVAMRAAPRADRAVEVQTAASVGCRRTGPDEVRRLMSQPVDPTTTSAWATLTALHDSLEPDLRGWFAADPSRADSLTFTAADLHVDLSKNLINADVLAALVDLADQVGLAERRNAMFAGEHINVTEDRAVLHTAVRLARDANLVVDGVDVVPEVH